MDTMNNAKVIQLEDVHVRYRVPTERVSGIKEFAVRFLQKRLEYRDFWALKGVSFQVLRGETFGVIGKNGAGKSTMLKILARILQPTRGRVRISGRISPLLELGGAFHPELTGRENVYLNMSLLGHSRETIDFLYDQVVEFSEIGDFINAPLRTYSTGMATRLGFSVAVSVRPDVLLIDEVLSVGDERFQAKSLDLMRSFMDQGTTIVFVSHDMNTIESFCDRVLWLEKGECMASGRAAEVVSAYKSRP